MTYLVRGEFVVTMQEPPGSNGIIRDGCVYVSGQEIVEIGRYDDLRSKYPNATIMGTPQFWVMPGFVNAHQHGKGVTNFQLGGIDEAFELSRIKGSPRAKVPPYLDTLYAALRMIESGITTTFHYNASRSPALYQADVRERLRAYNDAGLRVSFGLDIRNRNHLVYGDDEFLTTLPDELKEKARERATKSRTADPETYFRFAEQLHEELNAAPRGRIKLCLAPAGPQWCTEELLRAIRKFANDRGLGIQIHVLETKYQRAYFLETYGKTAIEWLDQLGFLSPSVTLAHGVWLSARDMALVAERGCAVVHNPSSNLRLKSGIAPVAQFRAAGIPLAMGLDSSALNDDMDMLQEMRLCANLQRVPGVGAVALPLADIFAATTASGSKILGWGDRCGTLEPGKDADLVLIDPARLRGPYLSPEQSPIDALIYRGRSTDVDTVMIGGEVVYADKQHRRLDSRAVLEQVRESLETADSNKLDPFDEQLLPHMIRYYQAWDDEALTPHYIVNSR
jgi:cytosine/adenosine deaminase-related metal-dependent hydrolase